MASKMYNRARMTVTSTGTGSLSLGVAVAGYQTFSSSGAQNGDTVSYTIEDGVNWEVGTGTFNSVAGTLSRTVTQSFNGTTYGTSAISVTTNAQVYITALAADIVVSGGALGTPSSGTLTNATGLPLATGVTGTLPVANGGTGLTSLTAGYIPYGNGTGAFGNSSNLFWDNTNTRLGVGIASPTLTLNVKSPGDYRTAIFETASNLGPSVQIKGSRIYELRSTDTGASEGGGLFFVYDKTAEVSRLTLDASGNLGLGVSPSAWAGFNNFQVSRATLSADTGSVFLSYNTYYNGNWKYIAASQPASQYQQYNGAHFWFTTGSTTGAAGGAVNGTGSFTQAMTLDASGNLDVGNIGNQFGEKFRVGGAVAWKNTTDSITGLLNAYSSAVWIGSYTNHVLKFVTNNSLAATIDTSGNLLVGSTAYPPVTGRLNVIGSSGGTALAMSDNANSSIYFKTLSGGVLIGTDGGNSLRFATNGSATSDEKMRIDGSGNLLVGTTSQGGSYNGRFVTSTGSGLNGILVKDTQANGAIACFVNSSNAQAGTITISGTTTTYGTSSDIRLKENITAAESSLASILAFPVDQFDWKAGGHTDYGCVAQKAIEYAPEMVVPGETWVVDYGRITPRLIKAFQELAAKVSALEAKQ